MPYTEEENGLLNNFAVEPKMYSSNTDEETQKKNYLLVGGVGLLLIFRFDNCCLYYFIKYKYPHNKSII